MEPLHMKPEIPLVLSFAGEGYTWGNLVYFAVYDSSNKWNLPRQQG